MELLELLSTIILLVTKPLSLAKTSCIFGLRSIFIIIQTWIELLRAAICFQLNIFWKIIIWAIAILSLPIRALSALQRERMLEMRLHEMQVELENLVSARKKLDERLQVAMKEQRLIEALLMELEDEHDEAISKIELLESELQHQKIENQRLKEVHGKALWSYRGLEGEKKRCQDIWEVKNVNKSEMHDARNMSKAYELIGPYTRDPFSWDVDKNGILELRRKLAFSRCFFSATLSLVVGVIVGEAKDPCLALIVALFVVAVISLMSVLEFYSIIGNKPASDAVALLSFNWFILGTLTFPILPMFAHGLVPFIYDALERMV